MTKEELEKEAENWLRKYLLCCNCEKKCNCIDSNSYCEEQVLKAYVDSALPREKQIQIDAEQIRALQKQNGELTDELKDLRESIKDYGAGCYENGLRNGKRKLGEQLTKAKEIIREFVEWATWQGSNCPNFKSIQDKAEAFLNSEVEK